jgi:hypothetical protein
MKKYKTVTCAGRFEDSDFDYEVTIALGEWDGVEDYEDEGIFYYMDGEPLEVGTVLDDGFVITEIDNKE